MHVGDSALRIVRRLRAAAPCSEPIRPIERRLIVLVVLLSVLGAWSLIWTARQLEAHREYPVVRTKNIHVSLEPFGLPARG